MLFFFILQCPYYSCFLFVFLDFDVNKSILGCRIGWILAFQINGFRDRFYFRYFAAQVHDK